MSCITCGFINNKKAYNLLGGGIFKVPKILYTFKGWDKVNGVIPIEASSLVKIYCPKCNAGFEVVEEWYEFNDTGLPFHHGLIITRSRVKGLRTKN